MNVLVLGSGGREHALAWKLRQSPRVNELYVAPGNAGTALVGTNLELSFADFPTLLQTVRDRHVDLTVVGPEVPLAAGVVDRFQQEGLSIFGPTQAAARIESSKVFSKALMERHGIPTARARTFSVLAEALRHLETSALPVVVKADGLAAGKGVTVCQTRNEAAEALRDLMERRAFGVSGAQVLVEECLVGREVSVFAFTDGKHLSLPVAACDYKRLLDGDLGPNTGGMGSYSPPEFWNDQLATQVMRTVMEPTVAAMAAEGAPFRGVLYAGLMLTQEGPKVIEFNCRLGDPEAQALLPRLRSDLLDVLLATVHGTLDRCEVRWSPEACVGVVLASQGYPGEYRKGVPIEGLDQAHPEALVFHATTRRASDGRVVTDGGRVLTVVGLGPSLKEARQRAYRHVGGIRFEGVHFRRDIAAPHRRSSSSQPGAI